MSVVRGFARWCVDAFVACLPNSVRANLLVAALRRVQGERKRFLWQYYEFCDLALSLDNLRRCGFAPKMIVDCGAYEGEWTRLAAGIFPDASFLMVEPQEKKRPYLDRVSAELGGRVAHSVVLAGPENRDDAPFFELEMGSSALRERSSCEYQAKRVLQRRLDDFPELADRRVDLLKLDTQGFEIEVMKGCPRILGEAEVAILEASLIQLNEGAPLLPDVIRYMDDRGFRAYDLCGFHRRPVDLALAQIDVVFVRKDSKLIANQTWDLAATPNGQG